MMEEKIYKEYCAILAEELQPAMGCTEPIAVAYCAALARKTLGCLPEDVQVYASANIIKNVKSVVVPNTGGAGANCRRRCGHCGGRCRRPTAGAGRHHAGTGGTDRRL